MRLRRRVDLDACSSKSNSETVFVQFDLCANGSVFYSYFGEAKLLGCQSAPHTATQRQGLKTDLSLCCN